MLSFIHNDKVKSCLMLCLEQKKNGQVVLRLDKTRLNDLKQAMLEQMQSSNKSKPQMIIDEVKHFILYNSELKDFTLLDRFRFPHLTNLELHVNQLQHIQGLYMLCSTSTKFIHLEMNQLMTLDGLEKCNTPALKWLSLRRNKIGDISQLSKCTFPELKELLLENNQIIDISSLSIIPFNQLVTLELGFNKIYSVEPLTQIPFPQLQRLSLKNNQITYIKSLTKCNCPSLKFIDLSWNNICELTHFERLACKNGQLCEVHLDFNPFCSFLVMTKFIRPKNYRQRNISVTYQCTNSIEREEIRQIFEELN